MSIEESTLPLAGKDIATLTPVELVTEVSRLLSTIADLQRENAKLRKALTPFSRVADMTNRSPSGSTVGVNIDRCRDARDALASTGGEHHADK